MNKQLVSIIDEQGNSKQVELASIFPSERENKVYIAYTNPLEEEQKECDLFIAILVENGSDIYVKAIDTDEEFEYATQLLRKQLQK
ncbi:MAG: DUF1292 domain-containing protein [Bacilli bacterium]